MSARVLVCVPVGDDQIEAIKSNGTVSGPSQVFTATPELLDGFGLTPADDEEADYAVLLLAGLWSLREHGRRFVLTAMVDASRLRPGEETANGGRVVDGLQASTVEAYFTDDDPAVAAAAANAIAGCDLDTAWDTPEVVALHADHDLLWHSVVELGKD